MENIKIGDIVSLRKDSNAYVVFSNLRDVALRVNNIINDNSGYPEFYVHERVLYRNDFIKLNKFSIGDTVDVYTPTGEYVITGRINNIMIPGSPDNFNQSKFEYVLYVDSDTYYYGAPLNRNDIRISPDKYNLVKYTHIPEEESKNDSDELFNVLKPGDLTEAFRRIKWWIDHDQENPLYPKKEIEIVENVLQKYIDSKS